MVVTMPAWRNQDLARELGPRSHHAGAPAAVKPRSPLCYHVTMSAAQTVLDELLEPIGACFTPEVAERVTRLVAPESTQMRMEQLARKSEEGSLSETERDEYAALVSASNFIAILQSKARKLLKNRSA